jgi:hypothetical protein
VLFGEHTSPSDPDDLLAAPIVVQNLLRGDCESIKTLPNCQVNHRDTETQINLCCRDFPG